MSEHRCACTVCAPEQFELPAGQMGEGHTSVRFGNYGGGWQILVNGVLQRFTIESYAGNPGWVINLREPIHICPCRRAGCMVRLDGAVQVQWRAAA